MNTLLCNFIFLIFFIHLDKHTYFFNVFFFLIFFVISFLIIWMHFFLILFLTKYFPFKKW